MAIISALKGREMPNHKYTKRELVNGKWRYSYDDSSIRKASNPKAKNVSTIETSPWAKSYLANRTKKVSALTTEANVSTGKSKASSLVKIDNGVYRAKTTTVDTLNDSNYSEYKGKVENELDEKMKKNEESYRSAYEKEKQSYENKLMDALRKKYSDDIPESEKNRVKSKVEDYSKSLWEDVYEPQLKRLNNSLDQNKKQILRSLKQKYESDQKKP